MVASGRLGTRLRRASGALALEQSFCDSAVDTNAATTVGTLLAREEFRASVPFLGSNLLPLPNRRSNEIERLFF